MTSSQHNGADDLSLATLWTIFEKIYDITYNTECEEVSGENVSAIDGIPISILNLEHQKSVTDLDREGSNFMWKTLLIDCLISMDYEGYDDKTELVQILKEKYKDDPGNLQALYEFDTTYKKSDAIYWYKKESCICVGHN